jgi:hypothetical protein
MSGRRAKLLRKQATAATTPDGLPIDPEKRSAAVAAQFNPFKKQLAALGTPSPPTPPLGVARRIITAIPAANKYEGVRVMRTRREFVRCVVGDSRTCDLFAQWRGAGKLDLAVSLWSEQLDAAAVRLRLPHRSAFLHDEEAGKAGARLIRAALRDYQELMRALALGPDVDRFIGSVLYADPPPMRAWLGLALLDAFEADIFNEIFGEVVAGIDNMNADVLASLPNGLRPKPGDHVERNARWYYQTTVQVPPAKWAELAEAYRAASDVPLQPKYDVDIRREQADDHLVRLGVAEARRLLELNVAPKDWHRFQKKLRQRRR